jgi:DNA polymerase-4
MPALTRWSSSRTWRNTPGSASQVRDDGDLTPLVEPISIDEAFLDLAGTERLHKDTPARAGASPARVESEIGITVSVGLSYCKFLAKVASDLDKPRGFSVIGEAEALLSARPRR